MQMDFALVKHRLEKLRTEFDQAMAIEMEIVPIITKESSETALAAKNALRATCIEGVYTGIEDLMKVLLKEVDGGVFAEPETWHKQLLMQAAEPNLEKKRAAIISSQVYDLLDQLRAFRHFERNHYRHLFHELRVDENMGRLKEAFPLFEGEIKSFLEGFDSRSSASP